MAAAKFKQIKAKPIKIDKFFDPLRDLMKRQAGFSNKQFGLTYKTWEHKPSFEETFEETKTQMTGSALAAGEGSKENPYLFVTRGTAVRYATMSPDFQAKSKVRVIGSSSGRGGKLYVDKSRPRPGIKAREFEEEIAKQEQPKFEKRGEIALSEAVKASGHRYD